MLIFVSLRSSPNQSVTTGTIAGDKSLAMNVLGSAGGGAGGASQGYNY